MKVLRDRDRIRTWTVCCDVLVDHKFSAGQRDGLTIESRSKIDSIPVVRIRECLAQ